MKRSALREFLKRVALASLPAAVACGPPGGGGTDAAMQDLAADQAMQDLAADQAMQQPMDLSGDLADMCLGLPPAVRAVAWNTDAGPPGDAQCFNTCQPLRPPNYFGAASCKVVFGDGGQLLECTFFPCGIGRRPPGLIDPIIDAQDPVAAFLAAVAHLEAASVTAFQRLAGDLTALGAPRALVGAARRAARDESRHAHLVGALAQHHGAAVPAVEVAADARRSLVEVAIDNAGSGQVGETWGAIIATWQAGAAADRRTRSLFGRIASDETRHAELAWQIAAWAAPRLTSVERSQVAGEQRRAVEELAAAVAAPVPPDLAAAVGLPSQRQVADLFTGARRAIWAT